MKSILNLLLILALFAPGPLLATPKSLPAPPCVSGCDIGLSKSLSTICSQVPCLVVHPDIRFSHSSSYSIYNVIGSEVVSCDHCTDLSLDDLPPGIYVLTNGLSAIQVLQYIPENQAHSSGPPHLTRPKLASSAYIHYDSRTGNRYRYRNPRLR